jgi:hypothetical protein
MRTPKDGAERTLRAMKVRRAGDIVRRQGFITVMITAANSGLMWGGVQVKKG